MGNEHLTVDPAYALDLTCQLVSEEIKSFLVLLELLGFISEHEWERHIPVAVK